MSHQEQSKAERSDRVPQQHEQQQQGEQSEHPLEADYEDHIEGPQERAPESRLDPERQSDS